MYLKSLHLTNFKSHAEASFEFNSNVNGIVGANGSGKTNLLDAIHYLSFGKSCFSAKDVSSVRLGTDFFALHGDFADEESGNTTQVSCVYKNGTKSLRANKKEYDRLSDHVGLFPVVMVSPYDSDIINDGNEVRRRFFDKIISQFDKIYLQHLIHYKKLLQQRNAVLRQQQETRHSDYSLLQVIDYLQEHDFSVYVVSGSDRYICRELFEGMVDVPSDHFIGMDVALEASGQGDADTLDYTFQPGDELVRTDVMQVKNLKTNKVTAIMREIGKQPVLSFGNTSGDSAMHIYTISNNPYKSLAFMLIADDDVRDYGHPEKADELRQKWEGLGFQVISMKNDFRTIYGESVKKTGTFHWTEELSGR